MTEFDANTVGFKAKQEAIQLLLITAAQNAITTLSEDFKAIHFDCPNALMSAITNLTKLKMLEVTVLEAMHKTLQLPRNELVLINEDVLKTTLIQMVRAGSVKAITMKEFYGRLGINEVFDQAEKGPEPTVKSYEDAVDTLNTALDKIREAQKD